jgi:hypothetical protein
MKGAPTLTCLAIAAALRFPGPAALAQWSPDASAGLGAGYGGTALGSSVLQGTRQLGRGTGQGSAGLSPTMRQYCARWPERGVCRGNRARAGEAGPRTAASQARMAEHQARLRPEYEARLRRDGQASADRWLRDEAARLGQQDARAARQAR